MTLDELTREAPGIDWTAFAIAAGIDGEPTHHRQREVGLPEPRPHRCDHGDQTSGGPISPSTRSTKLRPSSPKPSTMRTSPSAAN